MPYFDPRPKEKIEDFYNREQELKELINYMVEGKPLILVLGLKRTGKTSLLKVALNEANLPYIMIDCRVFESDTYIRRQDFVNVLERELRRLLGFHRGLLELLRGIRGVTVAGFSIKLNIRENKMLLSDILANINDWAKEHSTVFVLALDEAQELIRLKGINLLPIIAYAYDNLRNISIVLSGSKIGLMYRFLRIHDPSSPLYGRVRYEVHLKNLNREKSIEFLAKGFEQLSMKPQMDVIEEAVNRLNGVIGWLTYFGILSSEHGLTRETIDLTLEEGSRLALEEVNNFLKLREQARKRYVNILHSIALGYNSWSEIKKRLEIEESREVSSSIMLKLIRNLVDAGFVMRANGKYLIPDPVLEYAIRKYYSKILK